MKQFSSRQVLTAGLTPLLLSLAVTNAYAADVVRTGTAGRQGADATTPGAAGGVGTGGQSLTINPGNAGAVYNRLSVTGGRGGDGGMGGPGSDEFGNGSGTGGSGGRGGNASATTLDLTGYAGASALGGDGGHAGSSPGYFNFTPANPAYGNGGSGGAAVSSARTSAVGNATALAEATGGIGGNANGGAGGYAGVGGAASAAASASSLTGNVGASAVATGGAGGNGTDVAWRGGRGGNATLTNAVRGTTVGGTVTLSQRATGGQGGNDAVSTIPPYQELTGDVRGGRAVSTLVLDDAGASALTLDIASIGGAGGTPTSFAGVSNGDGGAATSSLTLTSARSGSRIDVLVSAVGGAGGESYQVAGRGGSANASADLRGAAVGGRVAATGGYGDIGGNATASLRASGSGVVRGTAEAAGGAGIDYRSSRSYGAGSATLMLSGDGAEGASLSSGGSATSNTSVTGTGALAVDVQAQATASGNNGPRYGAAVANTVVNTVRAGVAAGTAAVRAVSVALGGDHVETATATTDVRAAGDIFASSKASGGSDSFEHADSHSGDSVAMSRAITSGAHNVNVTATALSNIGNPGGDRAFLGNATAGSYGRSGSGVVESVAVARGGYYGYAFDNGQLSHANASATAVTTRAGGVSLARAEGEGLVMNVTATAQGIGAAGGAMTFAAGARSSFGNAAQASASNRFRTSAFDLPQLAAVSTMSAHVGAGPADAAALGLGANVAAAVPNVLGTGVHAAGVEALIDTSPAVLTTSGEFSFATDTAQRLLLGFVSSTFVGSGFDALDLTISNNGVTLLSQSFTTLAAANLYFNDHVVDLGLFGAGNQHLVISSSMTYAQQGAYAFNYVLGGGAAFRTSALGVPMLDTVSAVPEPSAWLMMSLGMGGMLLVARRRKAAPGA
ncbi:hypothetical protein ASF61_06075 [Duganella sp. Leaf126]|uniref:beta strand repeat-containing protein n=1 Tax=Duganella sp. Leaf126 TaxID=1736266 RepID=UPI000714B7CF|nr:PEP-CTERM sorting domain-containing protein [Duganella sp. Leaf126]KQQ40333.1 hypothetical protein ASF61_06075 [Duganella sp. Leaf126]